MTNVYKHPNLGCYTTLIHENWYKYVEYLDKRRGSGRMLAEKHAVCSITMLESYKMKKSISIILTLIAITTLAGQPDYFPAGTIRDFTEEWYGKHLTAMEEPSLYPLAKDASKEIYRFTMLPSGERPISVRIELTNDIANVTSVKLTGFGAYEPGDIEFKETDVLDATKTADLIKKIYSLNFTSIPTLEEDWDRSMKLGGSRWIFEGVKDGKYHVIDRWSPEYETDKRGLVQLVEVCNYLLRYIKDYSNQNLQPTPLNASDDKDAQGGAAEI